MKKYETLKYTAKELAPGCKGCDVNPTTCKIYCYGYKVLKKGE